MKFDLQLQQPEPEVMIEKLTKIDVEAEIRKNREVEYWPDKDYFLSKFPGLAEIDPKYRPLATELLYSFRHIFYNNDRPDQFRQGINMQPIKIERLPGLKPRKEKARQISEKKKKYLEMHIKNLVDQGVIEEVENVVDCYASPVHIVIEQRYVASKGGVVEKSRLTSDMRQLNLVLPDSSYPLPNMDQFRREIAGKGYRVFTTLDCAKMFNQIVMDRDCAIRNFGILALGKVYAFLRGLMGCKSMPAICQKLMDTAFQSVKNTKPFLDDLSIKSKDELTHLKVDLPEALAVCSFYNILLQPEKTDLMKSSTRILGHQISQESMSLSGEKREKIMALAPPRDAQDNKSKLAFMMYFLPIAPRLNELLAPFRKFAKQGVKFQLTDEHVEAWEAAKSHLLDDKTNAIRMPSSDPSDVLAVWTDSSASVISCIISQMQRPISAEDGDEKKLYIIACWSSTIPTAWENYPIWLLELISLANCCRKYKHLLAARVFYCLTDSTVLTMWASLDLIPKDLARKILGLQKFQYRLLYIEGKINPADCFSRLENIPPPAGNYPRFVYNRIYNARGEAIPWQQLFSKEKCEEARNFFVRHRRQTLSKAVDSIGAKVVEDEDEDIFDEPDSTIEVLVDASNEPVASKLHGDDSAEQIIASIAALELDDDDIAAGRVEETLDTPVDDPLLNDVTLPVFDDDHLRRIKNYQNDEIIEQCKKLVDGRSPIPSKIEALSLPTQLQDLLRHFSNFKLTSQGVLMRLWIHRNEEVSTLVVVSDQALQQILKTTHEFKANVPTQTAHLGQRKTMAIISKAYFAFHMRRQINKYISSCAICRLNTYPPTRKEDDGEHIATEPNQLLVIDYAGPYAGFAASATSGSPRYVFIAVDACSRYVTSVVTSSTNDDETFRAILEVRKQNCGLAAKISADGAILRENSKAKKYLEANQVRLIHGLPTISRCQSRAEKSISSISRLFCKYHTAEPSIPFDKLVQEATIAYNSAPSDGLPNNLAPRDVHFNRAPTKFTHMAPELGPSTPGSIRNAMRAAAAMREDVLCNDVASFVKRKPRLSATNYSARLRPGDLCLQRRTSFPVNAPKKLAFKVLIEAYEVKQRVATNSFRCESLLTGEISVIAGDLLIKTKNLSKDELIALCAEMQEAAIRNAARSTRRTTRSMGLPADPSTIDVLVAKNGDRHLFQSTANKRPRDDVIYDLSNLFSHH